MENVQLWLLEEMSSANLSGARGLNSASDFPPQIYPSSHPHTPPLGFRSRKRAKGTVASLSQPWLGGGGALSREQGYTSSLLSLPATDGEKTRRAGPEENRQRH